MRARSISLRNAGAISNLPWGRTFMSCENLSRSSSAISSGSAVLHLLAYSTAKVFPLRRTALLSERRARRYVDSHWKGMFLWLTLQKSWKKTLNACLRKALASSGPRGSGSSLRPHWPNMIACTLEMCLGARSTLVVKVMHASQYGLAWRHCIICSMDSSTLLHSLHL